MKKFVATILATVTLFTGTQALAASENNNGNHYGWNNEKNPHYVAQDPVETKLNELLGDKGSVVSVKHETYTSWVDGEEYPKITVETTSIDAVNFLFNSFEVYSVIEEVTGFKLYTPGSSSTGMGVEFHTIRDGATQLSQQDLFQKYADNLGLTVNISKIIATMELFEITIDNVNEDDKANIPKLIELIRSNTGCEFSISIVQKSDGQESYILTRN
jgi:hypothetical protein